MFCYTNSHTFFNVFRFLLVVGSKISWYEHYFRAVWILLTSTGCRPNGLVCRFGEINQLCSITLNNDNLLHFLRPVPSSTRLFLPIHAL